MKDTLQIENQEWISSLDYILENESKDRAQEVLDLLREHAATKGLTTSEESKEPYVNSFSYQDIPDYPGNIELEQKLLNAIRWNVMAMVVNANKEFDGIGGHISTFSSVAHLVETGMNHFFKGYTEGQPDLIFWQGHASPGQYARSFLEHRFDEIHLNGFRREVSSDKGLPSYPHPRSFPDYWSFPTVSMGLGPMQAIYQARFLKYQYQRGNINQLDQKVWAFLGDGEMDEPEATGALAIAAREHLNNLIFIVNCNLQRLDGPVRGNNKVVNELSNIFKGAGWKVIKNLWSTDWEPLFNKDTEGRLTKLLGEVVDGELQQFAQANGTERRQWFLERDSNLETLLKDFEDEELDQLSRGGHDFKTIFRSYQEAIEADQPVVILAQSVKGYQQGDAGEASNVTHQTKKLSLEQVKAYRDNLEIPISDNELAKDQIPFYRFEKESEEYQYLTERRESLSGTLPERRKLAEPINMPDEKVFQRFYEGSDKPVPTTGVFVQILSNLLKDKKIKDQIVPIIPDEARTFGMDSLYRTAGIYAAEGQQYEPVDQGSLMYYREGKEGIILEEGITEAGAISSFIAAGTSHLNTSTYTIPFYTFYSMFGFQRIGDFIWAAADARARGFLVGGVSGRTSLSGEGLQHADGNSHLQALVVPSLKAYDPAFAYEMAVIVKEGIRQMYVEERDVFFYLTMTNQKYAMPKMPNDVEEGILNGIYSFQKSRKRKNKELTINLLGSGAIMAEVIIAADELEKKHDIPVNIWSVTGYKQIYDHITGVQPTDYLNAIAQEIEGPVIAASDYVSALPLSVSTFFSGTVSVLGTDGYGFSDTTPAMRAHFKVDAPGIIKASLNLLVKEEKAGKEILETIE